MRFHFIAGILLLLGALDRCGGGRPSGNSAPSPSIPRAPSAPLPLTLSPSDPPLLQGITAGSTRGYTLALESGQYLQMVVQQLSVDVVVKVFDPAGHLLLRVDSPNDAQGPEEIYLVAATAGRYLLKVEASKKGSYTIQTEILRNATPQDRTRAAAAAAYSRGHIHEGEGQNTRAAASYEEAARLWKQVGSETYEAWSLYWLGRLRVLDPDHRREAIEILGRSLGLYRRIGDRRQEAMTLYFQGVGWSRMGEVEQAGRTYEEAISYWKNLGGELFQEATCLNDLAIIRLRQGRLHAASELYSQAIGIWQQLGEHGAAEATTRTNLGLLYATLGEARLALFQYRQALARLDRLPDSAGVLAQRAITLSKLGDTLLGTEGPEPALVPLRKALELRRRQHDVSGQAVTLNSIGLAQLEADRPREALEAFRSAGEAFERLGNQPFQAVVLNNLGIAYERLGHPERARESFDRGLALTPDGADQLTGLFGLARVARAEGSLDEAERRMDQVLGLVEGVRGQVWRPDLRSSYQAARQEQYSFLIDLLADRHRRDPASGYAARALAVSERARARSLLDLLSAARTPIAAEEVRRLGSLSRQINDRHLHLLSSPQGIANTEVESELETLLESWRQENAEARGPLPAAAAALSLTETQSLLDEDTLLLEYFLGEKRSFVWAVTRSGIRFISDLPGKAEVEAVAGRAYLRITQSRFQTEEAGAHQAAAKLSRMILGPVADLLGRPRLVIVAHGALQSVPFAALPRPDGSDLPLMLNHEIVSLPSVSVLAALRSQRAYRTPARSFLAVVADPILGSDDERLHGLTASAAGGRASGLPRLPFAGREAQAILALAGSKRALVASGFEANRDLVQSGRLSHFRILHFATHGLFNDSLPELSGLALSAFDPAGRPVDGHLRAYEISNLALQSDLVVLSACQTALGREVGGEGLVGLTQAFLHAGALRLVVALWDVDDRSTSELMKRFYTGLLRENLPPAEALRRAQVSLRQEPRWRAPYYWAGFVLQGEWR